jgi:hypothetical protein
MVARSVLLHSPLVAETRVSCFLSGTQHESTKSTKTRKGTKNAGICLAGLYLNLLRFQGFRAFAIGIAAELIGNRKLKTNLFL